MSLLKLLWIYIALRAKCAL